jgi:hypothetical protein
VRQITFHTFTMGDVEDPEIYAAQPLWEWQQTEQGQWVIANCTDPQYRINADSTGQGHLISVYGVLGDKDAVFYELKWGNYARLI